jgi:hypothetical protein
MGAAHLLNLGSDGGRGHGHREGAKKSLVADERGYTRPGGREVQLFS